MEPSDDDAVAEGPTLPDTPPEPPDDDAEGPLFPDAPGGSDEDCSVLGINTWVDAQMRDYYLYYDQVPVLDLAAYDAPEPLVRDLRVDPPDQFSNIGDAARQRVLFDEGRQFGYGFRLGTDDAGALRFANIVPGSPMEESGIERGDVLLAIDTIPTEQIDGALFDELLGRPPEPRSPVFTIRDGADGEARDVQVTSREYDFATVVPPLVAELDGVVYGYLPFLSFLATSEAELDFHFDRLARAGVTELILDMRYNGGGYTFIAHRLASHVAGAELFGEPLEVVQTNDRYPERGFTVPFPEVEPWLGLSRVAIIATNDTASSSEIVINGLVPHIDVAVIGSTTSGKPFQSRGRDYCGKRLNAMEFISTNVAGESVIDGIAPTCAVEDDVTVPFGDRSERMLSAAFGWLRDGVCPSTEPAQAIAGAPRARAANAALDGLGDDVPQGPSGALAR